MFFTVANSRLLLGQVEVSLSRKLDNKREGIINNQYLAVYVKIGIDKHRRYMSNIVWSKIYQCDR